MKTNDVDKEFESLISDVIELTNAQQINWEYAPNSSAYQAELGDSYLYVKMKSDVTVWEENQFGENEPDLIDIIDVNLVSRLGDEIHNYQHWWRSVKDDSIYKKLYDCASEAVAAKKVGAFRKIRESLTSRKGALKHAQNPR
ncbi:MAG: hypothetical protein RLY93_15665 [Sumerlaeia bacterium]